MTDAENEINSPDHPPEISIADPEYWRVHPEALSEALVDAADGELEVAKPPSPLRAVIDETSRHLFRLAVGAAVAFVGMRAMPKPHERRLTLTVEEAAQRLGISRALAYEAVGRDEIPHIKIGRRILVPVTALDKLLASASPSDQDDAVNE